MAQNSEYTRTDDGLNVPCLTPPPLRPALPLLLPLLLEVLLAGRVRVGVRVPLHGLGLVACLLQLVLDEPGGAAPRGSTAIGESLSASLYSEYNVFTDVFTQRSEYVLIQCIHLRLLVFRH